MSQTALEWKHRAEGALRAGRRDEAVVAYREYLALEPSDADGWFNLGYVLRAARRFEPAVEAYRTALAYGVARPEEVHLNLAVILSEHCGRDAEARTELAAATRANPAFLPAWLNLGNLLEDLGDDAGAREAYEAALAVDPACGRAHGRRGMVDLHRGDAEGAAARLEALLRERVVFRADDQAEVLFALGHALDAVGDFDRAFSAIDQANRLRTHRVRYDPRAAERLIDATIAAGPARLDPVPADGLEPVFICGLFRSGSTLAEVLLERRFGLAAGGELEAIPAMATELGLPLRQDLALLDQPTLAAQRATYGAELARLHGTAGPVIDKRCDNFLQIGLIRALFPAAPIIHTRRDPRDTLVSLLFGNFDDSMAYTFSADAAAHWIRQYQRLMTHWRGRFGETIFGLDYEALVSDAEPVMAALGGYLGINPVADGQAPAPVDRAVRTLSSWQVRQPLHRRSAGRWQSYRKFLDPILRSLEA